MISGKKKATTRRRRADGRDERLKNNHSRRTREYFPVPMNPRRRPPEPSSAACDPSPSVFPSGRFATNSGGAESETLVVAEGERVAFSADSAESASSASSPSVEEASFFAASG